MKVTELRIGNWVMFVPDNDKKYKNRRPVQIFELFSEDGFGALDKGRILSFCNESPTAEGIPLTPEILLACGFEYEDMEDDSPYERWVCKDYKQLWVWNYNKSKEWMFCLGDGFEQGDYKYLHQLQNLYFCLTGQELTVTL